MRVLVTGADGMLGVNIVQELVSRNHEISVFVLPNSPILFPYLVLNRIEGNILDLEKLTKAVEKHDAIIHVAALTDVWPYRSEMVRRVNIEGTKNIAAATVAAAIPRLVVIGSASSCGIGSMENPGTEETTFVSSKYGLDYIDSKKAAQDFILKEARENGLPAIMVNPTFMFGAYDSKPGAGQVIAAINEGKIPGYPSGGRNYIFAKDVAVATVNALTMGRVGECYIAGNQNLNYKNAFNLIAETIGAKAPTLKLPALLMKSLGWLNVVIAKIFRITPVITYAVTSISADEHYFSSEKAIKELGLPQTDLRIAVKECFDWMKQNNVLG
jgi:dihydroflavonol-4-reductase